ncbi:heparanase-like protein 2 [Ipomoea triloba]|uniref:heparanase-like protein 2 n=1 Tax=Ipomoea triloba TaxID=35885 RepID=UPI00125D9E8D|nr:heparanase-like protein 2 [Ipomoea triloba]
MAPSRMWLCCFVLASSLLFSLCLAVPVKLTVRGVTTVAETEDNFVCATMDWWPETKCNYNQCPWGKAGLLNLDLENEILINAIKAFDRLRLRVGGSLEDQVLYEVGYAVKNCTDFKRTEGGLFGFSQGCLHMSRWDELHKMFNETRAVMTFGLNALFGRQKAKKDGTLWVGDWNPQNARDLMEYTVSKGYKVESYELGNELCGSGVSARVEAEQYGKDIVALKNVVEEVHPNPTSRPKVLGPAGFYDEKWFNTFLQTSGANVVDGLTHHIYNLGSGDDENLIHKIQDPFYLDRIAQTFKDVSSSVQRFGPWSGAWVGEAGGAYNSGGKHVSHYFADGFWYLDQLGMTATFNHKVYCRQALIGGNYALLNTTTFIPNPDYYGALLWNRLMGKKVLAVSHDSSPYLRTYAHCSKHGGGITVLLINMSNSTTFRVRTRNDMNLYSASARRLLLLKDAPEREEYHLTPEGGNIQTDVVLLNGTPLKITNGSRIPVMNPRLVDPSMPINVAPYSIVFANIKGFRAPAC